MSHWSDYLVTPLPAEQDSTVSITVNPSRDHRAVVVLASRLRGLVDALRERCRADGPDPLTGEDRDDLLLLLTHLHRVRMVLQGQEERVLVLARQAGWSLRDLAAVLELSGPNAVDYRLKAIERAGKRGCTAAALDDDPAAYLDND